MNPNLDLNSNYNNHDTQMIDPQISQVRGKSQIHNSSNNNKFNMMFENKNSLKSSLAKNESPFKIKSFKKSRDENMTSEIMKNLDKSKFNNSKGFKFANFKEAREDMTINLNQNPNIDNNNNKFANSNINLANNLNNGTLNFKNATNTNFNQNSILNSNLNARGLTKLKLINNKLNPINKTVTIEEDSSNYQNKNLEKK